MSTKPPKICQYAILNTPIGLVILSVHGPTSRYPENSKYVTEVFLEHSPGSYNGQRFGTPIAMVDPEEPLEHLIHPAMNWLRYRAMGRHAESLEFPSSGSIAWVTMESDKWPDDSVVMPLELLRAAIGPEFLQYVGDHTTNLALCEACQIGAGSNGPCVETAPIQSA